MIYEWTRPIVLTSRAGTLNINPLDTDSADHWKTVAAECRAGWSVRSRPSDIPRQNGQIKRRRFISGTSATLTMEPWMAGAEQPVCGSQLTEMMDDLRYHLWCLAVDTDDTGRVAFHVEAAPPPSIISSVRMLDDIALLSIDDDTLVDDIRRRISFTVDSPFPYLLSQEQRIEVINATTDTITMYGGADFFPVVQVYGAFSTFEITHNGLGVSIGYDDTRPGAPSIGGGQYLEIDFFRQTATKVAGAVLTDAWAGLIAESGDFFTLVPGANSITTDADVRFLVNEAWA